ncbi:MAG TPA: site-specific integrase [Puia sp.]|nr:site-specific integrase [Puia sp.]
MKTTHSFGVDFIIRRCKDDNKKAYIFARIQVDGERREISLKERINATDWNFRQETVKGKSIEVKALNKYIDDVRFKIKHKYRLLQENDFLITAETLKQEYFGVQTRQKGHKLHELLDYYKKIWEEKLKWGGFKNYETTIRYIKLFLGKQHPDGDIFLSQLNMQLATDFEHFVRSNPIKEHDPCFGNGLAKHVQRFKRMINWAVEIEWLTTNPFEKYSCPLKKNRRKKLTMQELVALQQQLISDEKLNYVKDLFLFSCYTGLAYVDAISLKDNDLEQSLDGTMWCKIYRTKSGGLSPVPLLRLAIEIIDRYKIHPDAIQRGTIFPHISNQHLNKNLRVLREVCRIDTPMTFHIARHTFAKTVALKNGVPLETVQMMLGHSKIATTQIYADVDEEKIMDDMSGLEDKISEKKKIILASMALQSQRTLR